MGTQKCDNWKEQSKKKRGEKLWARQHRWRWQKQPKCGFQLLPHAPYSPDLAPPDFYSFPKLKFHLHGCQFQSDDKVIYAVKEYLEAQNVTFFY